MKIIINFQNCKFFHQIYKCHCIIAANIRGVNKQHNDTTFAIITSTMVYNKRTNPLFLHIISSVIHAYVPATHNLFNPSTEVAIKMTITHPWMIIIEQPMHHHYSRPGLSNLWHAGCMWPISWFWAAIWASFHSWNVLMFSPSSKKITYLVKKLM